LENIDDALHLARSCKLMYEVLDPVGHRLSIFSHIIVSLALPIPLLERGRSNRY
jgi:hypothetical protein